MAGYVGQLEPNEWLDARDYFEGPWRSFHRVTIDTGSQETFTAAEEEYSIFVMSGNGDAVIGSRRESITDGSSLVVGYRASVTIEAPTMPVELFVTTLDVRL